MAQQYSRNVTLTSDLSTIAVGFRPTFIRVEASTAGTAYLSFNTTQVATTASSTDSNSWQLTSGATPLVVVNPVANGMSSSFTAIAATGSTTLVRILALRL